MYLDDLKLPRPEMVIGDRRVPHADRQLVAVEDPSCGTLIGHIASATIDDVDLAVTEARKALGSREWSLLPPYERGMILEKIARKIEEHADELALLESYDNGKPVGGARAYDVANSIQTFRYMAGWCTKLTGTVHPVSAHGGPFLSHTQSAPVGVVGAIVPWNGPLIMAAWKIAPALAAGCTVVLKPSELTPYTALRLAELALEAGLPAGVLNVVTGYGNTVGKAIAEHPGINKIAFTGSSAVGKQLVQAAAPDLKRLTLELGGKSPSIIFADANLEKAIPGAAMSVLWNSGQICIAGSRVFVEERIFDDVVSGLAEFAAGLHVGDGRDPETVIGPLISEQHRSRVVGFINRGVSEGGKVVTGGKTVDRAGYFVEPTVFVDNAEDSTIMREEIFGPVIAVAPFRDKAAMIKQANDTKYGLGSYIWTTNLSTAYATANQIEAGSVWINTPGVFDPAIPFGGFKQSGWGREMGEQGIRAYTEDRTITAWVGD